jgi:hypothetical protein
MAYHDWEVPTVYSSVDQEFEAATAGAALIDHSLFGRFEVNGADGLDLLHRLSTNDLMALRPGQVVSTVLTTDKGRLVDCVTVAKASPALFMVVSPNNEEVVTHWIDRYCITEDVRLRCTTNDTSMFTLIGPGAQSIAAAILGADLPPGMSLQTKLGKATAMVAFVETPRARMVHMIIENSAAVDVWMELSSKSEKLGAIRMGFAAYESFRIARGIPDIGGEITGEFNPYEVGLRDTISMTKGCYLGQEVIARLDTYQKVRRKLIGVVLTSPCHSSGAPIPLMVGGEEVGVLTSCSSNAVKSRYVALAVVRADRVDEGDVLFLGGSSESGIAMTTPIRL